MRPNSNDEFRLFISSKALEIIENEADKARFRETGGVLAGRGRVDSGAVTITHSSRPGPKSVATEYSFQHDRGYCQDFLDDLARETNGEIDYLGEWHKHFESDPRPSSTDRSTLANIATSERYHVSCPLLLIVGQSNRSRDMNVFKFYGSSDFIQVSWEIASI